MEACGSAHDWAREIERLGHQVRQMSPQFVTPYRKGNKNDPNDAEAVIRPSMRFVPIKRDEEQDMQELHRVRETAHKNALVSSLIRELVGEMAERLRTLNLSPAPQRMARLCHQYERCCAWSKVEGHRPLVATALVAVQKGP
jgi:transposase